MPSPAPAPPPCGGTGPKWVCYGGGTLKVIGSHIQATEKNFKGAIWEPGVCPQQLRKQSRLMSDAKFGNREVKGQEMGWTALLAGKSDMLL